MRKLFLFLLLAGGATLLWGQNTPRQTLLPLTPGATPVATRTPSPSLPASGTGSPTPQTLLPTGTPQPSIAPGGETSGLFRDSLANDLRTSSLFELLERCRQLGLAEHGTRTELEQRILDYYGAPSRTVAPQSTGAQIRISRAETTSLQTDSETGEKIVRFDGGVLLEMEDKESGSTHAIRADAIVFNQTREILTALGNVEYRLKKGGKEDLFRGDSLTFFVSTWEGFFFEGTTFQDKTVGGRQERFRFSGTLISRTSGDFIVLENGEITSSPALPANYHLGAKKVWIFRPGEWAVQDAVLHVGSIPVFYLPFFFYPGDEMFFHPVAGFRDREGVFLQTTTYLLGKKPYSEPPFASLQLAPEQTTPMQQELRGVFLRNTEETWVDPGATIKIMLDAYAKLGVFAGLYTKANAIGPLTSLVFTAGAGLSRNLYNDQSGVLEKYTPYFNDSGTLRSYWNSSYLFGIEVPLRLLADLETGLQLGSLQIDLALEWYSDPYMDRDFMNRQEDINWTKLFDKELQKVDTTPALKESLNWRFGSSFTPSLGSGFPLITSFSLPKLSFSVNFLSREIPADDLQDYELVAPYRKFYYPESFVFPDTELQLSGTLFSTAWFEPKTGTMTSATTTSAETAQPASTPAGKDTAPGAGSVPAVSMEGTSGTPSQPASSSEASGSETAKPAGSVQESISSATATTENSSVAAIETTAESGTTADTAASGEEGEVEATEPEQTTRPSLDLVPPWIAGSETTVPEEQSGDDGILVEPKPRDALTSVSRIKPFSAEIRYDFRPGAMIDGISDSSTWSKPQDVSATVQYAAFSTRSTASLMSSIGVFEDLLKINGTTSFNGQYKSYLYFMESLSAPQILALENTAWVFNQATVRQTVQASSAFLREIPLFSGSSVQYSLDALLFRRLSSISGSGNEQIYTDTWFDSTRDTVLAHQMVLALAAKLPVVPSINFSYTLPPLDEAAAANIALTYGIAKASFTWNANKTAGIWKSQPFSLGAELLLSPTRFFRTTWVYNPELFINQSLNLQGKFDALEMQFTMAHTQSYQFGGLTSGWVPSGTDFIPESLRLQLALPFKAPALWHNRFTIETSINSSLQANLIRFTESAFTVDFSLDIYLHQVLKLKFATGSKNTAIYRYWPGLPESIGVAPLNLFTDLARSFNFFSEEDRRASSFKLNRISIEATHYLDDWELTLSYSGAPELQTSGITKNYVWVSTLSILLQWRPVPEIKSKILHNKDGIQF